MNWDMYRASEEESGVHSADLCAGQACSNGLTFIFLSTLPYFGLSQKEINRDHRAADELYSPAAG